MSVRRCRAGCGSCSVWGWCPSEPSCAWRTSWVIRAAPRQLGLTSALAGLVCGLPLLGGLALASRFFGGTGARIAGGVMFAGLLLVGLGAVGFAGCICLMGTPNFH